MDGGVGFTYEEETGVSSDMKVLLNGSKLVGKVEVEAVHSILKVNATLRKLVKSVHIEVRSNLNSTVKSRKSWLWKWCSCRGSDRGPTTLLPLASALQGLRTQMVEEANERFSTLK